MDWVPRLVRRHGNGSREVEDRRELEELVADVPDLEAPDQLRALFDLVQTLNREGRILAYHDRSDGGLLATLTEMAFAGRLGLELDLADLPRVADVETDDVALFSESSARLLVEVAPEDAVVFEETLAGRPVAQIGQVIEDGVLRMRGLEGNVVIESSVEDLLQAWQGTEVV